MGSGLTQGSKGAKVCGGRKLGDYVRRADRHLEMEIRAEGVGGRGQGGRRGRSRVAAWTAEEGAGVECDQVLGLMLALGGAGALTGLGHDGVRAWGWWGRGRGRNAKGVRGAGGVLRWMGGGEGRGGGAGVMKDVWNGGRGRGIRREGGWGRLGQILPNVVGLADRGPDQEIAGGVGRRARRRGRGRASSRRSPSPCAPCSQQPRRVGSRIASVPSERYCIQLTPRRARELLCPQSAGLAGALRSGRATPGDLAAALSIRGLRHRLRGDRAVAAPARAGCMRLAPPRSVAARRRMTRRRRRRLSLAQQA